MQHRRGGDGSSTSSGAGLFASPKTVLENLDFENKVTGSSRNARVISVSAADGAEFSVSDADSPVQPEMIMTVLNGEQSVSYGILDIMKNTVAKRSEFQSAKFDIPVELSGCTASMPGTGISVDVQKVLVENKGSVAYVYSSGIANGGDYKFILRCTPNEVGTLDTELLMNGEYTKITSTANQKVKKSYTSPSNWGEIDVFSDHHISGYKQDSDGTKTTFYAKNNYSAVCWNNASGKTYRYNTSTGKGICERNPASPDGNSWRYYLNWVNIPSDWSIEHSDGSWKLKNGTDEINLHPETDDGCVWLKIYQDKVTTHKFSLKISTSDLTALDTIETLVASFPSSAPAEPSEKNELDSLLSSNF